MKSIFPNPITAPKDEPLAYGGDLSSEVLIDAYTHGIFPWPYDGVIFWHSPDPRAIFYPQNIKIQKSLRPFLRDYRVKFDYNFANFINFCKIQREIKEPTWIDQNVVDSYIKMHELGYAHSVEVYHQDRLIGGLYGLIFGKIFCGESMISVGKNASKVALITLAKALSKYDFIIDAQVMNSHLEFLGAQNIARDEFLSLLKIKSNQPSGFAKFKDLEPNLE
ncbi:MULTISPECIES: leucyl/phenylalanyl-tRNA--protein transferase [Campylobacter]|uniref:Leucyl/phenylalanyl-tRNA--protein transferase n=1 Tax=Campylobacter vicugnae TaxID=1660076 RepID=A0ABZ2E9H7_9BACT|nr:MULTISPECIES: leucyl/phenylalanyl-tRNA--protein transferase [unclassified Campylobacter]ARR03797.1 leucyl, phenylalanyl-tRNA-protein transferase [Campylobacter sp. RM12175]MCR8689295.1 leucyl/phenylalanyl-tRNA--protein transferase [Campylobacter sp. RM9264]MCR8700633.1 leucyl/phenylalanyl-tRNA--protein transferase [Campylobacter sp. RM12176]